jgi:hypothetical protein
MMAALGDRRADPTDPHQLRRPSPGQASQLALFVPCATGENVPSFVLISLASNGAAAQVL